MSASISMDGLLLQHRKLLLERDALLVELQTAKRKATAWDEALVALGFKSGNTTEQDFVDLKVKAQQYDTLHKCAEEMLALLKSNYVGLGRPFDKVIQRASALLGAKT